MNTNSSYLKIDSGENPYAGSEFYMYPDPKCTLLRKKLGLYTGFPSSWIACGNGSDELIDLIIRAFVDPSDEIILNPPTFSMYSFYGKVSGATRVPVLRNTDLTINTLGILDSISDKTKIIFIDSPGNPTSTLFPRNELQMLLNTNVLVVMDEAYFEYCKKTSLSLMKKYKNLIVLRTLSKWAGLAGLRIGYMIANPNVLSSIYSIKSPYNVNSVAQTEGVRVLDNKKMVLQKLNKLISYRSILVKYLSDISQLKVFPSQGAYIVFKPKSGAEKLGNYLLKNRIYVKVINQLPLQNCIRINILNSEDSMILISYIRRYYENKN